MDSIARCADASPPGSAPRATVGTRDFVFFLTATSYQEARTGGSPDVCPPFPSGGSTNSLDPPLVLRDMAP